MKTTNFVTEKDKTNFPAARSHRRHDGHRRTCTPDGKCSTMALCSQTENAQRWICAHSRKMLKDGMALTEGFPLTDGTTLDEGMALTEGFAHADGTVLKDGMSLTDGFTLIDGTILVDGVALTDGSIL